MFILFVQVKFTVDGDFMPIPESSLRTAIKENYSNGKFSPELTLVQVKVESPFVDIMISVKMKQIGPNLNFYKDLKTYSF